MIGKIFLFILLVSFLMTKYHIKNFIFLMALYVFFIFLFYKPSHECLDQLFFHNFHNFFKLYYQKLNLLLIGLNKNHIFLINQK